MGVAIETDFLKWRDSIYGHMLRTRGAKYKWFLRHLKLFRLIAKNPQRADFLETYYTLMRYVDDIVDGDAPIPHGYKNSEEYLLQKIAFAQNPHDPADDVDFLILYCFQLGTSFNESFSEETEDIFGSLLFDARRMGKRHVFSSKALMAHYHQLDIVGTIRATLKLFNEDSEKYKLLKPLGLATRFYYDLRDFNEDIQKGIVNISSEDMEAFGISVDELSNEQNPGIRYWFRAQALRGIELLDQHTKNIKASGFRFTTRLAFPVVYGWFAKSFFKKVLRETKDLGSFKMPALQAGNVHLDEILK